jgi:thiol-disulfide isomerase/thioredoxin
MYSIVDVLTVVIVLAALVALSTTIGLIARAREGRVVVANGLTRVAAADVGPDVNFGEFATIVQFSTEFCAKCPATRVLLARIASETLGVVHVDVDVTHRQDLTQRFTIMQTPTTLVLDDSGAIAARIGGAPRPEAVKTALGIALRRDHGHYII